MNTNGMKKITVLTETQMPRIKKLFESDIENFLEISHFSIIVITPQKEAYIASTSKLFSDHYQENKLHQYDNTMCPLMYQNHEFYTWAEGYISSHQKAISQVKKSHELHNGAVFVRKLGSCTLLYCVATKNQNPALKTTFVNNANGILTRGDYCYNEVKGHFDELINGILLPKIDSFKPFLHDEIPCVASYEAQRKADFFDKSFVLPPECKRIYLGGQYPDVYFTGRQADCMMQFILYKNVKQAARSVNLAPRTAEDHLRRMKEKLDCQTLSELILCVLRSNFVSEYMSKLTPVQVIS